MILNSTKDIILENLSSQWIYCNNEKSHRRHKNPLRFKVLLYNILYCHYLHFFLMYKHLFELSKYLNLIS